VNSGKRNDATGRAAAHQALMTWRWQPVTSLANNRDTSLMRQGAQTTAAATPRQDIDGAYAWGRLLVSLLLSTIGGIGLWSVVVALPAVQAEFGVQRGAASLPYTMTMLGVSVGGVLLGRLADRVGIVRPLLIGALALSAGFILSAQARSLWEFILVQGLLIGLAGTAATFGPLMADVSHWFNRRRGIAVAICASGNYLAGTLWPPLLQAGIAAYGWRQTHIGVGVICLVTMLPLILLMRRRSPIAPASMVVLAAGAGAVPRTSAALQQTLLVVASFACCIAMAMPQVHIVAYCADLGFGPARGAEMLSLMLGLGIVSRVGSGFIADRIGGAATLLLGSGLQCLTLLLFLPFDGLMSLYVVSALFGLSQGGIIPSYAIFVRERFPANEAGARVGLVIMATTVGMAVGGWLTGVIFDLTGSYQAAFLHGIGWNVLNLLIALWLWHGGTPRPARGAVVA
jgi:MFS family permease